MDLERGEDWLPCGEGVQVLRNGSSQTVPLDEKGLAALNCIHVLFAIIDPWALEVIWKNAALCEKVPGSRFEDWLRTSGTHDNVWGALLDEFRRLCSCTGCIDVLVPGDVRLPFLDERVPFPWIVHSQAVTMGGREHTRRLVTFQAPAWVEPPIIQALLDETPTDRVVGMIDNALRTFGRDDVSLKGLRERVLEGRMHEPIFAFPMLQDRVFSWDISASLAMMGMDGGTTRSTSSDPGGGAGGRD